MIYPGKPQSAHGAAPDKPGAASSIIDIEMIIFDTFGFLGEELWELSHILHSQTQLESVTPAFLSTVCLEIKVKQLPYGSFMYQEQETNQKHNSLLQISLARQPLPLLGKLTATEAKLGF